MIEGDRVSLVDAPEEFMVRMLVPDLQAGSEDDEVGGGEFDAAEIGNFIDGERVEVVEGKIDAGDPGNVVVVERQ